MQFHLGDILSITTGRLVSPRHMDGVYDILEFMTGDELFTHQLPRVARECEPYLKEQFPLLANITGEEITRDNWREWLKNKVEEFGEYHEVYPIHAEDHTHIDPIQELIDLKGEKNVIVIQLEDTSSDIGDINWKVE